MLNVVNLVPSLRGKQIYYCDYELFFKISLGGIHLDSQCLIPFKLLLRLTSDLDLLEILAVNKAVAIASKH